MPPPSLAGNDTPHPLSIRTSSHVTLCPRGTSRISGTRFARPIGRPPMRKAVGGRHQLAPDAGAALAVQHLAGAAGRAWRWRRRRRGSRSARRSASPRSAADRIETFSSSPIRWNGRYSAEIRPDGSVTTPYSWKQRDGVVVRRLERHEHAPAQVVRHRAAVAMEAGDHLDLAGVMQRAGVARPQHIRQFMGAAGRKRQAVRRRASARWHWRPPPSRCRTSCRQGTS